MASRLPNKKSGNDKAVVSIRGESFLMHRWWYSSAGFAKDYAIAIINSVNYLAPHAPNALLYMFFAQTFISTCTKTH